MTSTVYLHSIIDTVAMQAEVGLRDRSDGTRSASWTRRDAGDTAPTARQQEQPLPRVGRSLRPGKAGTIKLNRQFGPTLQLVRYRYDATGLYRFTTVELLVEQSPVTRGRSLDKLFAVRVGVQEQALRERIRRSGGRWNAKLLRWILDGRTVLALNLVHRVDLTVSIATSGHTWRAWDKMG